MRKNAEGGLNAVERKRNECGMAREPHPTMLAAHMHRPFGQLEGGGCEKL